ncbi:CotH kinase family protein, partial [Saprospiraceae bacterium]|nr:CotH kinase family protein [Saprospiraceae bacterium]
MKDKNNVTVLLIMILTVFAMKIQAQFSGESVFDINVLHELRLEFSDTDYWEQMEANYTSAPDEFTPIPYIMTKVIMDGQVVDSVGARFKGFTSYTDADKKPIKLDFNEFVSGQRLDGLRKLNLNNATADPSMQRDVVAYYMLREMGVSAPRTSFARLYINDTYWGIYQLIEQIDKEFLQDNFAYSGGNLYKNKGWNKLEYLGSNEFNYSPPYLKKTNKDENDWTGFINFVDVLNNSSDIEFKEEIQKVLNVHQYLKTLAVDVATSNWDSYLEHGRNWYVYEDIESNLINWIPWDYNLSFDAQLDFGGGGSSEGCDIWADYFAMRNGTTTVSFFDDSWKQGGSATYLWDFDDDNTSEDENPLHTYEEHGIYNVCVTIKIATCEETICKQIDTNYNPNDCLSITSGVGPSEANKAFQQLLSWVPDCCEIWSEDCEEWYDLLGGGTVGGANYPIDQQENEGVLIERLLSVESFRNQYYSYFCELMDKVMTEEKLFDIVNFNFSLVDQAVEDDANFLYDYDRFRSDIGADSISGIKKIIVERIEVLQTELGGLYDCSEALLSLNQGEIVINELVASNDSTSGNQDDQGQYNDWIEMFNNSDRHIDLSRLYLSNENTNLRKWKFPA